MIITHDLGQHLGCYGAGLQTPHLDRLAENGLRFGNFFCTAPQCSPSRGSVMTGKYPHRNGLVGLAHLGWRLNPEEKTLPMCLNGAGYETYLFGHQHEATNPRDLGYAHVVGATQGHDGKLDCRHPDAATVTGEFVGHLPELASSRRPFFASVGFTEAHRPYGRAGYDNDLPESVQPLPWLPDRPGIREDIAGLNGLVYRIDSCVGRIVGALDAHSLSQDTLIVFTTDHGIAMPRAKGTCYDPGVKVATIMNMPDGIRPGVSDALLSNVDLLPTLCEIARADAPEDIDGRSFLPLLEGRPCTGRPHLFCEMTWHDRYNPIRSVRTRCYKYIRNFGERPLVFLPSDVYTGRAGEELRDECYGASRPQEELYDLEKDPFEKINLAGAGESRQVLCELRRKVLDWMRSTGDLLLQGDWPPTPEQLERERAHSVPN